MQHLPAVRGDTAYLTNYFVQLSLRGSSWSFLLLLSRPLSWLLSLTCPRSLTCPITTSHRTLRNVIRRPLRHHSPQRILRSLPRYIRCRGSDMGGYSVCNVRCYRIRYVWSHLVRGVRYELMCGGM